MRSEAHHVAVTPAPLKVTRVPAFEDNYLWLIHGRGAAADRVVAVDPGDAEAILTALARDHLHLDGILVTHHHGDHVGGVAALVARYGVPVYGPEREEIPSVSARLHGGDTLVLNGLGLTFSVVDVPGHTAGQLEVWLESDGNSAVFSADVLHQPMQVYRPAWNSRFCELQEVARVTRDRLLADAAASNAVVFPSHFGAPHAGRIARDAEGYRFVPLAEVAA